MVRSIVLEAAALTQFTALFAAVALAFLANGLQGTATGVRAEIEGMPPSVAGVFGGSFIGSLFAPGLIQSVGYIRCFTALAWLGSAFAHSFPILVDPAIWIALRIAAGACFVGMLIVTENWLNAGSSRAVRVTRHKDEQAEVFRAAICDMNSYRPLAWGARGQPHDRQPAGALRYMAGRPRFFAVSIGELVSPGEGKPQPSTDLYKRACRGSWEQCFWAYFVEKLFLDRSLNC